MSPQLTVSSLFCVLALAGLCVMTGAADLAGIPAPAAAVTHAAQAEHLPGLLG